jgi:hypothetical protein
MVVDSRGEVISILPNLWSITVQAPLGETIDMELGTIVAPQTKDSIRRLHFSITLPHDPHDPSLALFLLQFPALTHLHLEITGFDDEDHPPLSAALVSLSSLTSLFIAGDAFTDDLAEKEWTSPLERLAVGLTRSLSLGGLVAFVHHFESTLQHLEIQTIFVETARPSSPLIFDFPHLYSLTFLHPATYRPCPRSLIPHIALLRAFSTSSVQHLRIGIDLALSLMRREVLHFVKKAPSLKQVTAMRVGSSPGFNIEMDKLAWDCQGAGVAVTVGTYVETLPQVQETRSPSPEDPYDYAEGPTETPDANSGDQRSTWDVWGSQIDSP